MTNEQINRTIAELCGWTSVTLNPCRSETTPFGYAPGESDLGMRAIPSYTSDLNACVEFERTLKGKEITMYVDYLMSDFDSYGAFFDAICSDANERCEAFLRVKGKWE